MKRYNYFVSYYFGAKKYGAKESGFGSVIVISPPIDSPAMIRETEKTIKDSEPDFTHVVILNFIKLNEVEEEEKE